MLGGIYVYLSSRLKKTRKTSDRIMVKFHQGIHGDISGNGVKNPRSDIHRKPQKTSPASVGIFFEAFTFNFP